jgi:hypothetical protein
VDRRRFPLTSLVGALAVPLAAEHRQLGRGARRASLKWAARARLRSIRRTAGLAQALQGPTMQGRRPLRARSSRSHRFHLTKSSRGSRKTIARTKPSALRGSCFRRTHWPRVMAGAELSVDMGLLVLTGRKCPTNRVVAMSRRPGPPWSEGESRHLQAGLRQCPDRTALWGGL